MDSAPPVWGGIGAAGSAVPAVGPRARSVATVRSVGFRDQFVKTRVSAYVP